MRCTDSCGPLTASPRATAAWRCLRPTPPWSSRSPRSGPWSRSRVDPHRPGPVVTDHLTDTEQPTPAGEDPAGEAAADGTIATGSASEKTTEQQKPGESPTANGHATSSDGAAPETRAERRAAKEKGATTSAASAPAQRS